jgi:hypothetical protein
MALKWPKHDTLEGLFPWDGRFGVESNYALARFS